MSTIKPEQVNLAICYFGSYDPSYSRNEILLKGLELAGVKVFECNSRKSGWKKYLDLYRQHQKMRKQYQVMVVGYSGYDGPRLMIFGWLLSRKKIIFDAFFSVYDTFVFDRCFLPARSFKAHYYWFIEWLAYHLADIVVYDTLAHIDYVSKIFKISKNKFRRIFIGAKEDKFYPMNLAKNSSQTIVEFHGGFIPLQGVDYIVRAAKLLERENVLFRIIGIGQTYQTVRRLAEKLQVNNVLFLPSASQEEINQEIAKAHICLGIFGPTAKASNVIPNKVFETLASGCPTITGDSSAVRELLANGQDILLCQMANPEDLAEKILQLKNDTSLQQKLALGGLKITKDKLTTRILGEELKAIVAEIL